MTTILCVGTIIGLCFAEPTVTPAAHKPAVVEVVCAWPEGLARHLGVRVCADGERT